MVTKICFVGLGNMGYSIAGWLSKKYQITVFNRSTQKAQNWLKEYSGAVAMTPAKAAQDADFVFICVGNDEDVRSVVTGKDGVLGVMKSGAVLVDHTTASAELAKELEQICKKKSLNFLDAPVSGGQVGAINGVLTIMVGGKPEVFEKTKEVMSCYGKKIELIGKTGSGQLAKMVNQICIAGLVQSLSEAINFGQKAGINIEKVIDVISKGAAQSWQMENRAKTMIEGKFDFGFALDWMVKDLSICFQEAKKNSVVLPITELVDKYYKQLQKKGKGRFDTSALIENLRQ